MDGRYAIPDGWFDYSAFGKSIKNTRIIPVKTPLKKEFNNGLKKVDCPPIESGRIYKGGVPVEEELTPSQLVARVDKELGKKVGAVIDLTFTSRYYNSKDLLDLGVKYSKIKCPGQAIPSEEVYARFKKALLDFLEICNKDSLIAVHCTHGLNRTGYLICRFLVESGLGPEAAIKDFNDARGHNIERKNYLQHLRDGCPQSTNSPQRSTCDGDCLPPKSPDLTGPSIQGGSVYHPINAASQSIHMFRNSRYGRSYRLGYNSEQHFRNSEQHFRNSEQHFREPYVQDLSYRYYEPSYCNHYNHEQHDHRSSYWRNLPNRYHPYR